MPFSTALYSENVRINLSFIIYCINIIATGLFNSFLWNYIGNAKNKLSDLSEQKDLLKFLIVRSLAVPISFTIGLILSFISPFLAKFSPVLIFPALKIINYKYKSVVEKYKRK